jgi:hypothetical protein
MAGARQETTWFVGIRIVSSKLIWPRGFPKQIHHRIRVILIAGTGILQIIFT